MKKIYITGVAGLLGNNLVRELKEKYAISGADRVAVDVDCIKYDVFDMKDELLLEKNIKLFAPDILIHTAAFVNVDLCEKDKVTAKQLNEVLTRKIAELCTQFGIKMIYISTDAVFDGTSKALYKETDEVNPLNFYAKTKLAGEKYTLKCSNSLILRTNIFGINIQNKHSFGEWIISGLAKNETLNMFEDIFFSPILVNDLAHIIDLAIEKDLSGLYHACGTGAISKYEFGKKVKEIFEIETGEIIKTKSESMQFDALRPKNMGMSNEKLRKCLDISICTAEESIKKFYALYYGEDNKWK